MAAGLGWAGCCAGLWEGRDLSSSCLFQEQTSQDTQPGLQSCERYGRLAHGHVMGPACPAPHVAGLLLTSVGPP